jgi:glutaredoxin
MRKLTKEEFVERAIKKHGVFYDYSKVVYINANTKVCIICPIHGEFWQTPDKHLREQGCPKCANKNVTKEEFIEKVILVHGEWYDYSKVVYVNNKTKVLIICPIHGEFWQTPNAHLSGRGCPHCGRVPLTKEEFVERSVLVHGDFYDYSKVVYVNANTKVCIICPIHGEFWQRPSNHLNGQGCPHCANNNLKLGKNIFIERSILVHGEWYDYSKVEYVNNRTKVCIICPDHDEFWQIPSDHLMGSGCPHCNKSKLETSVENFLKENDINYYNGYRGFEWLKNIRNLELDFYLLEYNVGIECQGIQHFESVEYFGGEEGLEYIQSNDLIKKQLCEEHGVRLFYINYNNNIEEKLTEILENI